MPDREGREKGIIRKITPVEPEKGNEDKRKENVSVMPDAKMKRERRDVNICGNISVSIEKYNPPNDKIQASTWKIAEMSD